MRTNYHLIFSLQILHSYYEGNICTCLQLQPAAATLDIMNRYEFKVNDRVNGFEFYSASTLSLSESLQYIRGVTEETCFEFDILCNDAAFYCFTAEVPLNHIGRLLYDSSDVTAMPGTETLLLKEKFSEVRSTAIAGRLKIRFDDLIKYANDLEKINFEISYLARQTQWQYYVVNRNAVELGNAAIKGKADVTFENEGTVTIETGEKALLFTSGDQLLPLSKFPKYKFDLVNMLKPVTEQPAKKAASKTIIKGLPDPDPLRIQSSFSNAKTQVSSPIYIYV